MNYRNLDGFKKLVDQIKAINPDVTLLFQITHSGSISNPVFRSRYLSLRFRKGGYLALMK